MTPGRSGRCCPTRARFGLDAVRVAIVGAAPCPPQVIEFWDALGISVCEVYGLSETTGVANEVPDIHM